MGLSFRSSSQVHLGIVFLALTIQGSPFLLKTVCFVFSWTGALGVVTLYTESHPIHLPQTALTAQSSRSPISYAYILWKEYKQCKQWSQFIGRCYSISDCLFLLELQLNDYSFTRAASPRATPNSAAFKRFEVKVGSKNVEKLILIYSKFLDSLSWIIALRSKFEVVAFSLERKPWIIYSLSPSTEVSWWGCRQENMRQMRFWVQSIWQTSSSIFWVSLQINYTEALWNIIYCWEPARFCTKWHKVIFSTPTHFFSTAGALVVVAVQRFAQKSI